MTALQEILTHADAHRLRCQSALDQLQLILDDSGLPPYLWPRQLHRIYDTLAHRNSRAQRDYTRALKNHSTYKPVKQPEPEPPPPPKREPHFRDRIYRQSAEIRVVDGKAVTVDVDYPAAFFLAKKDWNATSFCRTLSFEDGIVPEEYAYANIHNGETYPFAAYVFLYYSPEEFLRLCQLETDTNSPHLLDGERLHMTRHNCE